MKICSFAISLCVALSSAHADRYYRNEIPPREQWNANKGYCGEVSLISAGLYYGQYMSQFEARICAIGKHTPQDEGEMLLGVNDELAARRMHLDYVVWDSTAHTRPETFLRWIKFHVLRGEPVIIGVYNNERVLYGNRDPQAGDPQYDHIVPVIGLRSKHPLSDSRYFGSDRIKFSDNGLYGTAKERPYIFTFRFSAFPASREEANAANGPLYSLPSYGRNYGIAITGVRDANGDTLPVRVRTNVNYERPTLKPHADKPPEAMPLRLTVEASDLQLGVAYRLYRYNHLSAIPDERFNAHSEHAAKTWEIWLKKGSTFTIKEDIMSDKVAAYRCVRASAP